MYWCSCRTKNKYIHVEVFPTSVDSEGICLRCEHYAVWMTLEEKNSKRQVSETTRGKATQKQITLLNIFTNEKKTYTSIRKAADDIGLTHGGMYAGINKGSLIKNKYKVVINE